MNTLVDSAIAPVGYQIIEQIYAGSRTLVYRAFRESDQKSVILKLLQDEMPTFSELVQFRNQYTIVKNLDLSRIIQAYSLEPYGNSYVLVMEDFGGISLSKFAQGQPLDIHTFLAIALQLCDILHYLYQHRVIHKDIKPDNILIHPETKQVKLIDFSIASLLSKETQEIQNPNVLEGTLAYLSPEQTGRMNRGIDYRSDFYSLGITFFYLLTGRLPFPSDDPMELIHYHIVKQPPEAHSLNLEIPPILTEIVQKLMAKNAEDRYQRALGLKFDLETCLFQLKENSQCAWFTLGQKDISDRFLIPEKLYGRELEVATLLAAFERVAGTRYKTDEMNSSHISSVSSVTQSAAELMLVAGFSGIGKTAVVNEVHKPIVRQRGYFIKGKYDQFQRNIPFSAFVQAFRGLVGQLLSESDAQLAVWKTKILEAVGENGQVIIEVIPELEQLIGQQPTAPELSGGAAQNRFNLLFQKFVQVFTHKEHPLVIFLDDLQWADLASLKLLKLLMNNTGHLLILGAYRDNEVSPTHPLMLTVDEIVESNVTVNTITLQSLTQSNINQLVADTLSCDLDMAQPLTELVYQKTKGNPFFITQFLKALHQEQWIAFDFARGHWQCDIAQVRVLALTDDVVAFMAAQLQKLPAETQKMLKLAACIGAQFDLSTLAIVSELPQSEAAIHLWKALQEGLILPQNDIYKFYQAESGSRVQESEIQEQNSSDSWLLDSGSCSYKFLHDRVQQAAYSLIPDEQKQKTHWEIGNLLLANMSKAEQDERIFEIVNQLNLGIDLIRQEDECIHVAELNQIAGRKAKASAAYASAAQYLKVAIGLLPKNHWQQCYDLTLALYTSAMEAAYLNAMFEEGEQLADAVLQHSKTLLDRVKVYELKIQALTSTNHHHQAVELGLKVLAQLDVNLPISPTLGDVTDQVDVTRRLLETKSDPELLNLPPITDPLKLAAQCVMYSIVPAAHQAAPLLFPLITCEEVSLAIQAGNSPFSAVAYADYAVILNGGFGSPEEADRWGCLAIAIAEHFNAEEVVSAILCKVGAFAIYGRHPLRQSLTLLMQGYQKGLDHGDLVHAGYCAMFRGEYALLSGCALNALEQDLNQFCQLLTKTRQTAILANLQISQQTALNLLDEADDPLQLKGKACDEERLLSIYQSVNNRCGIHLVYFHRLMLCYLLGDYGRALDNAAQAELYLDGVAGLYFVPAFYFYAALSQLAQYSIQSEAINLEDLIQVTTNQTKLRPWVKSAPTNFQHKYDLIEAEKSRVLGQYLDAMNLYDRAIAGAKENQYCQEEALANELAAKFYLKWGKEKVAQVYMQEAYYGYARWDAKAKIADLETRYPQLLAAILSKPKPPTSPDELLNASLMTLTAIHSTVGGNGSSSSALQAIDLAAVLKAAQTLYSEIYLDRLLNSLMEVVVEIAGANKAALLLKQAHGLEVVVKYFDGAVQNLQPIPIDQSRHLPIALIHYIERTQEAVIADTSTAFPLASDPYLTQFRPPSFLGTPILNQGKLIGVLYLENSVTKGAFTRNRIELLTLLCSQAAVSLENAHLYQETQQAMQTLQQKEAQYRSIFEAVSDGLAITELETGMLLAANPAYCELHGYAYEELVALNPVNVIRPELHPKFIAFLNQVQAGKEFICNAVCLRKDGIPFNAEMRSTPFWYNGRHCGLTVIRDVTERKRMELAIQDQNQSLEQALAELQQAQVQMVQGEKMSALGNLVAGVAHEINNPVGFLSGNIQPALDYISDVFELLDLYQEKYPNPDTDIQNEMEAIDLEFLREDLPKLVGSMQEGIDRIKNISTSLRTFSRADSDRPIAYNIHDGLDSTILILKHRLKANELHPAIKVVKHYGNLPKIECFAGQLNQVFMNILSNAIDALEDKIQTCASCSMIDALEESNQAQSLEAIKTNPNRIILTTELTDDQQSVVIRIQDSGLGMTEEVKQKIFDHLFTTKEVGKGTGLGLAIARQIVEEKHGGAIEVNSAPSHGTEFIITLPIKA
jgi:PAS domain S-box-containing protein